MTLAEAGNSLMSQQNLRIIKSYSGVGWGADLKAHPAPNPRCGRAAPHQIRPIQPGLGASRDGRWDGMLLWAVVGLHAGTCLLPVLITTTALRSNTSLM